MTLRHSRNFNLGPGVIPWPSKGVTMANNTKRSKVAKNNRIRGRAFEKYVAKKVKGMAIGLLNGEDVSHNLYSFECKTRKKELPEVASWLVQATRNCPDGKTPVIVYHKTHGNHDCDIIIMKLSDFVDLYI